MPPTSLNLEDSKEDPDLLRVSLIYNNSFDQGPVDWDALETRVEETTEVEVKHLGVSPTFMQGRIQTYGGYMISIDGYVLVIDPATTSQIRQTARIIDRAMRESAPSGWRFTRGLEEIVIEPFDGDPPKTVDVLLEQSSHPRTPQ